MLFSFSPACGCTFPLLGLLLLAAVAVVATLAAVTAMSAVAAVAAIPALAAAASSHPCLPKQLPTDANRQGGHGRHFSGINLEVLLDR